MYKIIIMPNSEIDSQNKFDSQSEIDSQNIRNVITNDKELM